MSSTISALSTYWQHEAPGPVQKTDEHKDVTVTFVITTKSSSALYDENQKTPKGFDSKMLLEMLLNDVAKGRDKRKIKALDIFRMLDDWDMFVDGNSVSVSSDITIGVTDPE
jgi:hypothetical protein